MQLRSGGRARSQSFLDFAAPVDCAGRARASRRVTFAWGRERSVSMPHVIRGIVDAGKSFLIGAFGNVRDVGRAGAVGDELESCV